MSDNVNIIVQDTINEIVVNTAVVVETIDINVQTPIDEVTIITNPNNYIVNINRVIGQQVQSDWNQNDDQEPDYIKNKPTIPGDQKQSNWDETDSDKPTFIRNKPVVPTQTSELINNGDGSSGSYFLTEANIIPQVNSDWNAVGGKAEIFNKPTIPSISGLATTTYVDQQDALKVDKVTGYGLSQNDFTNTLKTKLDGIEAGAQVNVNADWNATTGDAEILNKPTIPSITNLVPYTGANADVQLGVNNLFVGGRDEVLINETTISIVDDRAGPTRGVNIDPIGVVVTDYAGQNLYIASNGIQFNDVSFQSTAFPPTGGTSSQYIKGDGTLAPFPSITGGGASVSYYLNGSVSQGTIGGVAYKEMNSVPVIGAGTDFTINADGYIAQFITDVGDPNKLLIPAGNWNFETYFNASSGGGSPRFYIELYKYDGTTFTLIASNSANPENITGGTNVDLYFSALAIPQTTLLATDRLAVRFYVIHSGRTITMHTENGNLSQIITTFSTGLTSLNGLTSQTQNFAVGTSGSNFNISSVTDTHTFNLPDASATSRGVITTSAQTIAGAKTFSPAVTASGAIAKGTILTPTLTAAANGDTLIGLDIAPTFTNGAFTSLSNYGIRHAGDIVPSISNSYNLGGQGTPYATIYTRILRDLTQISYRSDNQGWFNNANTQTAKLFSTGNLLLQNGGTFTEVASSRLTINSTTQGMLPPRMTTAQKIAISSPATGLIVYDTDLKSLYQYNGTSWLPIGYSGVHAFVKPYSGMTYSASINQTGIASASAQTANRLVVYPFIPAQTITCSSMYINVFTLATGALCQIVIYSDLNGLPDQKLYNSADLDCSTTGKKTATTTQTFVAGNTYWIGTHSSSTASLSVIGGAGLITPYIQNVSAGTSYVISPTYGSAPTTFGTPGNSTGVVPFIGITI